MARHVICPQATEVSSLEDPSVISATLSAKTAIELESADGPELTGLQYSKISWPNGEGWVLASQICEEIPEPPPLINQQKDRGQSD